MRVIYEASALGRGWRRPRGRTGIYRVARQVAVGLAQAEGCELTLAATAGPGDAAGLRAYVQSEAAAGQLHGKPVVAGELMAGVGAIFTRSETPGAPRASAPEQPDAQHPAEPATHRNLRSTLRQAAARAAYTAGRAALHLPVRPSLYQRIWPALHRLGGSDLSRALRDADVFHSPWLPLPARVQRQRNLLPMVMVHDLIPLRQPQYVAPWLIAWFEEVIASVGDRSQVICTSDYVKQDLCDYAKLDPQRVTVAPLGVEHGRFKQVTDPAVLQRVRQRYNISSQRYVLTLATLEPRKNVPALIRRWAALVRQQRIDDLDLVLVGNVGWAMGDLAAAAGDLRDRVHVTGFVADEDLAALYSGAAMFAFASLAEGFGLPPLEAMACGLPVVCANTTSLPEVVGQGEHAGGLLVEPYDDDAWCAAMLKLETDATLRSELARKAIARAATFTWENHISKTLDAYRQGIASLSL